jgi:pimeloyl-ACP methyl ester carboxylesterase
MLTAALGVSLVAACGGPQDVVWPDSSPAGGQPATLWLCQPADPKDPCDLPLASTAVHSDGSLAPEPAPATRQPVDCFYVYPTVSQASSTNAPMQVTEAERQTARAQVARFSSVCRVYAPIYRQLTTDALFNGKYGDPKARAIAHADVVAAWHDYLAQNPKRRFVLIGHSQGTLELLKLLQDEIDPNAALRGRLVSALLLGGMVKVPPGAKVGGDLKHIPLCTSNHQHSCVIAYNSFGNEPPPKSLFGRPDRRRHLLTACTNPAALGGGEGWLLPYFPAGPYGRPESNMGGAERVTTNYADYPRYLTARCMQKGDFVWLQVTAHLVPGDLRRKALPTPLGPAWGLHVIDVNLAQGNLVSLVRAQSS